jgi:molecular chaperone HtpG
VAEQRAFQVDLHGVVDLFAHHLYSSPRVFMRELLQNAVDAITARYHVDPDTPAKVWLSTAADPRLAAARADFEIRDSGIGLTETEAVELLATVGRSSKRDADVELARSDYLGQFGIGLLSAFMVSEQIELYARSARDLAAAPIVWRGYADGNYELQSISLDEYIAARGDADPGSLVRLRARKEQSHWLSPETIRGLASDYGTMLPVEVLYRVEAGDEVLWDRISQSELPWRVSYPSHRERAAALFNLSQNLLGFRPLAVIDLDLPAAGVTGVAFVLPTAVPPSVNTANRVYIKRMLVGDKVSGLLPNWAFFVRCVIDSSSLRPTASRESLYEDEVLLATREALGKQIITWVAKLLAEDSQTRTEFVRTHHLAIRQLALTDDEMLELAIKVLPFETTLGNATLQEFVEAEGQIRYAATVDDYRRVAAVARAQRVGIVNGGYVYDADLLDRVAKAHPDWNVAPFRTEDVESALTELDPAEELEYIELLLVAAAALQDMRCEPALRSFEPSDMPALFVTDQEAEHQRARDNAKRDAEGLWGDVVGSFGHTNATRKLVLNSANESVQLLARVADRAVQAAAIRSLYITARLSAGEPLRRSDAQVMNEALQALIHSALPGNQ